MVSVCMATFNGEKYLEEQIDSILKQLSNSDELVISDDGSTDRTISIIRSYQDPRIKLYHSTHKNLIYNFENALKFANGDFIFLSDQDDIWYDNKVSKSLGQLDKNLLVFSNATIFKDRNLKDSKLFFDHSKNKTGVISNIIKIKYLGATLAFRRQILETAIPFPGNLAMHDVWIGLIAELKGSTHYIDEPLIYYRRHDDTASQTGGKSRNSLRVKLKIRINLIINLVKRLYLNRLCRFFVT